MNLRNLHKALLASRRVMGPPQFGNGPTAYEALKGIMDCCDENTMRDMLLASKIVPAWKGLAEAMKEREKK